jgi:leukotriene-A4 hydrolase
VIFLRALPPTLPLERVRALNTSYQLDSTTNTELSMHWLPIVVRADAREAAPVVESFLMRVGRRRMIRPLYEAMMKQGDPWKTQAKDVFVRARPLYHPLVRETIKKIVDG